MDGRRWVWAVASGRGRWDCVHWQPGTLLRPDPFREGNVRFERPRGNEQGSNCSNHPHGGGYHLHVFHNPLEVEGSAGVVSDSDFREYSGMERGVLIVRRILQISPLKRLRSGLFSVHIRVTHTTAWQH